MHDTLYRERQLGSGNEIVEIRYVNGSFVAKTSASSPGVPRQVSKILWLYIQNISFQLRCSFGDSTPSQSRSAAVEVLPKIRNILSCNIKMYKNMIHVLKNMCFSIYSYKNSVFFSFFLYCLQRLLMKLFFFTSTIADLFFV